MTKYPNGMTEEELDSLLEIEWEKMKDIGVEKGILTPLPNGALRGSGDPDKWFSAVEDHHRNGY